MAKKSSKQKRYFLLKLKEDWFSGTTEKYLKSLPAGDSLLITYLKIQLMSAIILHQKTLLNKLTYYVRNVLKTI